MNIANFDKIVSSDKKYWTYKEMCRFESKFFHSNIYYIKSLLDARFSPRTFTLKETKELVQEVFPNVA